MALSENTILSLAGILRRFPYKGKTLLWNSVIHRRYGSLGHAYQIRFPEGHTMQLDPRDIAQRVMLASCYERGTSWFLKQLLKPGECFIDGGAYVGHFTCLAGTCVTPGGGRVYAFEPNPKIMPILRSQVALNPHLNIRIVECALSESSGVETFYSPDLVASLEGQARSSLNPVRSEKDWRQIAIRAVALDDFVRKEKIKKVALCKMDLEGAELWALKGARAALESCVIESLILEVTEETKEPLAEELERYDFKVIQDVRFSRTCRSLRELKKIGIISATNVLFLRGSCAERWRKLGFLRWMI